MNDQAYEKAAPKGGWLRHLIGRNGKIPVDGDAAGGAIAQEPPPAPEPAQVPPIPPELPPQPDEPIPAPGPDVIPPPATPGPEMPEPELPQPEMPGTPWPQPDIPGLGGPDVEPTPGPGAGPTPAVAHGAAASATARAAAEAEWIARRAAEVRARAAAEAVEKAGWLSRLRRGLGRSSSKLAGGIGDLFVRRKLDDESLEALEDLLITGDLGVETSVRLIKALSDARFGEEVTSEEVRTALAREVAAVLEPVARTIAIHEAYRPHVILVCGVNGSGKTTTIAKMAHLFRSAGFEVMLAAGDTFRAAAIEQLQIWGERVGSEVVARPPGSDAASLAFDAYAEAKARGAHVLLIDTAGRLHNKKDLMAELQKMLRVLKKVDQRAPHDCILVLDATVGQNAHSQVEVFCEMVDVTGLVVTKLDGSAKGGVVVALAQRFGLPVYAIGVGEGMDDMRAFEAGSYARSLLGLES